MLVFSDYHFVKNEAFPCFLTGWNGNKFASKGKKKDLNDLVQWYQKTETD